MNQNWQNFIQSQPVLAAQPKLSTDTQHVLLADLSHERLIAVTGDDARTFLQGQLSTDVHAFDAATSQFSSWNNAKGRVVTLLRIFERDAVIYISLPSELLATVLKRLRLYVLRSKVALADASDSLARFGVMGGAAPALLQTCKLPVPQTINAVTQDGSVQIIRLHGTEPRFALYGLADNLMTIWEKLMALGAKPAPTEAWELGRILAGVPKVHPETSEHFVAQMLGLEELGAIHFKKGCYLGQEVIARAHYRGAVKRHLHRAQCGSSASIVPGAIINTRDNGQAVAEVVDASRDANKLWQLLIVLQDEFVNTALQINGAAVSLLQSKLRSP